MDGYEVLKKLADPQPMSADDWAKFSVGGATLLGVCMTNLPIPGVLGAGAASYVALRFARPMLGKMLDGFRGMVSGKNPFSHLTQNIQDTLRGFFQKNDESLYEAYMRDEGIWAVKDCATGQVEVMDDESFFEFEHELPRGRDVKIVKFDIQEHQTNVRSTVDGKLDGDTPDNPALQILKPGFEPVVLYASNGVPVPQPREPELSMQI